jgi:hypothetical protein
MIKKNNDYDLEMFQAAAKYPELINALLCDDANTFSTLSKLISKSSLEDFICLSAKYGAINIVKLLLENNKVLASNFENYAICSAYENKFWDIVDLLLTEKDVLILFKKFNPKEYKEVIKIRLQTKIVNF